jgi:hypothetical protein
VPLLGTFNNPTDATSSALPAFLAARYWALDREENETDARPRDHSPPAGSDHAR